VLVNSQLGGRGEDGVSTASTTVRECVHRLGLGSELRLELGLGLGLGLDLLVSVWVVYQ
jgi:hypothetical protein